jgi:hypothetical protein
MDARMILGALLAAFTFPAQATDGAELSAHSKHMAAAASLSRMAKEAPFRVVRDPLPEMLMQQEQEARGLRGACHDQAAALCYDAMDGRVVYRPARKYMPQFEGLRAESISLRRDRLVFKYSFR